MLVRICISQYVDGIQKRPTYSEKSPHKRLKYIQKSPTYSEKSPNILKIAPSMYFWDKIERPKCSENYPIYSYSEKSPKNSNKRLNFLKRALNILERELNYLKKNVFLR